MKICSICQRCYEDSAAFCVQENHGSPAAARSGTREIVPNYQMDFLLERDANSEIYEATHLGLDQSFVIKLAAPNQNLRERFEIETRAAENIRHPNVARVYDSGTLDDGEFFIVSEAIDGKTVREFLRNDGSFSEAIAVMIATEAAEGLEAAHAAGIAHRAVSPSNIILTKDEEGRPLVKLQNFDFGGISQQSNIAAISGKQTPIDALRYMSPEQYAGQAADARTDIYSLGVVLYEMLTGRSPFDAPTRQAILHQPINEQPLERLHFDTRALLTHTLRHALQKTPNARPQTAAALARQLRHVEQLLTKSTTSLPNSPRTSLPSNQTAFVTPEDFDNLSDDGESFVEESKPRQTPMPLADSPATTTPLVLSMPEEDTLEEDTLIRAAPVSQPKPAGILMKESTAASSSAESGAAYEDEIDSDLFAVEPIRVKRKETVPPISKPFIVPVPNFGGTRAQPANTTFTNSAAANYSSTRFAATRQPLLIGVGLIALLAFIGLGALLYNRQSGQSATPATAAASPEMSAPRQSEEINPASGDLAATTSDAPEIEDSALVDEPPLTASENLKNTQPRTETPVNNPAAKANEPLKEVSTVEKPLPTEPENPDNSGEPANDGAAQRRELNTSLDQWVTATNARDVDQQMNYYAPKVDAFYRTRNVSQDTVRAEKRRVFDRAGAVDIRTSEPEIALSPDGQSAKMRFRKKYVIQEGQRNRSGEVIQELHWVKSGSGWKIVSERDVKVINR